MRERPILFSGPMVQAILEGRKTQTRRVVKPSRGSCILGGPTKKPVDWQSADYFEKFWNDAGERDSWWSAMSGSKYGHHSCKSHLQCPYGQPGDRLWVRETHRYAKEDLALPPDCPVPVDYKATPVKEVNGCDGCDGFDGLKWRPSIHMPRWASRLTLEIVSVRVERLKDISEGDCIAEGCPDEYLLGQNWFKWLWDGINGKKHPWESNPWVWVVEFQRLQGGH